MKAIFKAVLTLLFVVSLSNANDIDLNKIAQKAKEDKKELMFFFHIPHCPYCERMLKKNFKDKEILKEINKAFVLVDIYTKDEGFIKLNDFKGTRKEFAKKMGIKTYPYTLFTNSNFDILYRSNGYRNIDEYLVEIKYVSSGTCKDKSMSVQDYADELEFEKDD